MNTQHICEEHIDFKDNSCEDCKREWQDWSKPIGRPKSDSRNQSNATRHVCPNCQQWQYDNLNGFMDCFHECAKLGFAPRITVSKPIN